MILIDNNEQFKPMEIFKVASFWSGLCYLYCPFFETLFFKKHRMNIFAFTENLST